MTKRVATSVVVLGLSGLLAGCSSGSEPKDSASSTTAGPPVSTSASVVGLPQDSTTAPPATEPPRSSTSNRPRVQPPATGDLGPSATTLPSGEIRVRGTVASVDRAAPSFTLVGDPAGYSSVVLTKSTEFRGSEAEHATFADVEPGAEVSVTGTAAQGNRLVARRVVVLA